MDIKSPEERSRNMARIKSRKTKPEMYIRSLLFRHHMRYRVNFSEIIGKPDLYFTKYRTAVFVNGCFWHRHKGCKYAYVPKSNVSFWKRKFEKNQSRDREVTEKLMEQGIRCLIIWECTVKKMTSHDSVREMKLKQIIKFITSGKQNYLEI
ncbi:very short patch repair endonuclease [Sporolactobacillus sp. THM19-2]|uniref:very short patch repair endonuclease n=1 Tax=Sporolactobacillus sp. THM19-2 TaxID=2511171 RepID=UPI00102299D5|nr:very short patch repair endonuclease [Sporolactobacillus sp. THM19-2]RYL92392.1 DNA mismatch endonuclease Vsr [Sporolactobacillus sp. THM19-2]